MRLASWNIMAGGGGRGFRIDHAFASAQLATRARGCWSDHTVRELGLSDHSALVVDLAEWRG